MIYSLGVIIALIIMGLGERLSNQTKVAYEEKGYKWNKVILYSNIGGLVGGLLSLSIVLFTNMPVERNPQFLPFAITIMCYIIIQGLMTDFRTHLINRKILRFGYLPLFAISVYNVTTPLFSYNRGGLILFTILLILMFLFIPIGASDVRAMAIAIPYVISISGYDSLILFLITLLIIATVMEIKRRKPMLAIVEEIKVRQSDIYENMEEKYFVREAKKLAREQLNHDEKAAVAVGPYMVLPFVLYLLAYPFII